jgi:hypothetical protein
MTIWICRWRMNMLVTPQYQPRLSSITNIFSKRISRSDCSIQIKLNYYKSYKARLFPTVFVWYSKNNRWYMIIYKKIIMMTLQVYLLMWKICYTICYYIFLFQVLTQFYQCLNRECLFQAENVMSINTTAVFSDVLLVRIR